MSGNFSLTDLFKVGLDKDKFIKTHSDMKSGGATGSSSICDDGMENSTGQIFEALDFNKNGVIDEEELVSLRSMGKTGNNEELGEDDVSALYEKSIENTLDKYGKDLSPDGMFSRAQAAAASSGGMVSSDYIQTLEEDIVAINELIEKTQVDSDDKVEKLQTEIDDYVQQSKLLDEETKAKHKEKTQEINKLRKEKSDYEAKVAKAQNEQKTEKNQIAILKRDIEKLDSEKDANEIAVKQEQIKNSESKVKNLAGDISSYQTKISSLTSSIKSTENELKSIQASICEKDKSLKEKISKNNENITTEQTNCNDKIASYRQKLEQLQNAKDYAYQNVEIGAVSAVASASSDVSVSNNPQSIEELEAMGIKYSSDKGAKLAQTVKKNLKGFTGYCSAHVSNALAASGLGTERTASAYQMADKLAQNKNFKEIKVTSKEQLKSLPAGCIVVYAAGAANYNAKHGHIEVTFGDGTAGSDGQTRNMRYTEQMRVFVPIG